MMKIPMSVAAAGLLRAVLARAKISGDRILLTDIQSTEWQSLTFVGERHQFRFRIAGPAADGAVRNLTYGLRHADFSIPGHIVADIALVGEPEPSDDGSVSLDLEALTIAE
jgi:hypothetical protein